MANGGILHAVKDPWQPDDPRVLQYYPIRGLSFLSPVGLTDLGYSFDSETDTEVIAHRIHHHLRDSADLYQAMRRNVAELKGAYALAVVSERDPDRLVIAREGCPVVIGLGIDENFVASDVAALFPVTRRFMFLEEGDVAEVGRKSIRILNSAGAPAVRPVRESDLPGDAVERGQYRHFMLKEIHEQPRAIAQTLNERIAAPSFSRPPSGRQRTTSSIASRPFTLRAAARATTRASWPATSSNNSADFRHGSRSQANIVTATRW
jgi:hypothetical protein